MSEHNLNVNCKGNIHLVMSLVTTEEIRSWYSKLITSWNIAWFHFKWITLQTGKVIMKKLLINETYCKKHMSSLTYIITLLLNLFLTSPSYVSIAVNIIPSIVIGMDTVLITLPVIRLLWHPVPTRKRQITHYKPIKLLFTRLRLSACFCLPNSIYSAMHNLS